MINYSKTINLPSTTFSMKANLSENENKWIEFWKNEKVYEKLKKKNQKMKKHLFYMMVLPTQMEIYTWAML